MRRSGFFRPGERIGVAVSGGPDSVLLFDFMKQMARELGLQLAVVHFNHRLRGAESDADERFVRELARGGSIERPDESGKPERPEGEVEFVRGEADVARVAREKHRNLEATARDLRYRFFFSLVNQGRVHKVATAHTANDQAETVLLKLLRGAGTRGLGGIYPVLEGKVVRPFLGLTRAEVEAEIARRRLDFRVDSTNRDPRLARNKIRMELLPLVARDFNPAIVRLLKSFADQTRDDEAYLEQQASERARAWRVREGTEEKIPLRPLVEFPPAIERRVLRQMIAGVRGGLQGVTREHVEALRRFAREAQSGRQLALPGGVVARKEFDWLVVSPEPGPAGKPFAYPVAVPGSVAVADLGLTFHFKIVGADGLREAYNEKGVICLEAEKLSGTLVLRNWRAGDRFQPKGSRRNRKLKELFRQRKIRVDERSGWPVLECGGRIVWVRGFPAGADASAAASGEVLVIQEERHRPSSSKGSDEPRGERPS
jgi:tRNA(Ile)-lysidine synthase